MLGNHNLFEGVPSVEFLPYCRGNSFFSGFDGYLDFHRYYSRRSRSRERDTLNGSSSRSHREEHDVRRSSHWERHRSDARKRLKTPEEKKWVEETNSKHNRHDRNRTHDTDSNGDWSDRVREENGRRAHKRKSSRHQEETSDSDGDFLDEGETGRRRKDRKKSPGKQKEVSESPNDHRKRRSRTHDSEYTGDRSDGDRERHLNRRREGSRNPTKVSGLSDDHRESGKINQSDSENFEIQCVKRRSHSTKWDRSSMENIEAESQVDCINSDRYDGQRAKLHDLESRYDRDENIEKMGYRESEDKILQKSKRSKRKLDDKEDDELVSPARYNRRSKSRDSEYDRNEDDDDRWDPEGNSPKKKCKSRSVGASKEFEGKSKSHDGESRSRHSRRSSRGKRMESLEKMDSAEELRNSEDNNKRYKRSHGHKRVVEN